MQFRKTRPKLVSRKQLKVWWKCPKGPDHEWDARIKDRVKGNGCPCCAGRKLSVTNSLSALLPQIAKQWHPTKNKGRLPEQILAGSNKYRWWKCPEGADHEWRARVIRRWHSGGRGCPFCAGKKISITNNLGYKHPEIASDWHFSKNGKITPRNVFPNSHKGRWWKCKNNR